MGTGPSGPISVWIIDDQDRFGRIRVSAPLDARHLEHTEGFAAWSPPFVRSQLESADAVVVLAGAREGELAIDLWLPLVEP